MLKKHFFSGTFQVSSTNEKHRKFDLVAQFLRLLLALGVAVLAIGFWIPPSLAQSADSACFMTTPSGEVISLDSMCGSQTDRGVQTGQTVDISAIQLQLRQKLDSGDFRGAIESYGQFIAARPNSAEAFMNRGLVYQQMGDGRAAISDFQRASQLFRGQGDEEYYRVLQERIEEVRREL
ncbi:MAG: tetratricopeptide repeat protein [Leptolyngbyaceae cyanobacterium SM1_3_5]|nr:tetratricopeptide repeat protein [Leptolyngbyaceae cyanobacterium SM1_3_5]